MSETAKKGGRYTKKDREERKLQVFHLHFEESKSAVEIAKLLNVNRNTINDDISYWYQQVGNQQNVKDITPKVTRQILLIHLQRDRLIDYLEDAKTIQEKIKIEKLVFDMDNKLTNIYLKMLANNKEFPIYIKPEDVVEDTYDDISENTVFEFTKYLISSYKGHDPDIVYSADELRFSFCEKNKCPYEYAIRVVEKMKLLELSICLDPKHDPYRVVFTSPGDTSMRYLIAKFARLRGYVPSQVTK